MRNLKTLKATQRVAGFTALIAVIILTLSSCVINVPDDKDDTPNTSLNGVWDEVNGGTRVVSISGSTATLISFTPTTAIWVDAVNKGYYANGTTHWRNLRSNGNLSWRGDWIVITYRTSNPNVATGTDWVSGYWTMSANGKTLYVGDTPGSAGSTWSRR